MSFVNVNSFALLSGFALAGLATFLLISHAPRPSWLLWIALALALLGLNLALRPGSSTLTTPEQVEAALHSGKPTLLEFYSNL